MSRYHGRRIEEWLADDYTMSSRELLALIDEFPDDSELVIASSRTFRVAEIPDKGGRRLMLFNAIRTDKNGLVEAVELPEGSLLIEEFVDWTHDRKIAARHAREMAIFRAEHNPGGQQYDLHLQGVTEPLQAILNRIEKQKKDENIRGAKSLIRGSLFGEKGGDKQ